MRHLLLLVATLLSNLAPTEDGSDPIDAAPLAQESRPAWPPDWEREFQARKQRVLKGMCLSQKADGLGNRTYFENEKRAYGFLMAHLLAGDQATALRELQKEDAQARAWHAHTSGIDYYACFTLKHQVRKYFLFGDRLDPAYRQRMFDGARAWTERDPLRRPHPAFVKPGDGWGPDVKNSWVDVRSTENLFLMRVGSVYLMAEETGNEEVRKLYKARIQRYVWALFNIGMGEWDSENYHCHTIGPYINLFDFAKDPEVRMLAKAALDYLYTTAALKYYRGGFAGPIKRDYNKPYVFGGAAGELHLFFADTPQPNPHYHRDVVHPITSAYRPPLAVMNLARKQFKRPVEIFRSHPTYSNWEVEGGPDYPAPNYQNAPHKPEFFETTYFAHSYQLGTLASGSGGDVNGFKLLAHNSTRGADFFVPGTAADNPSAVSSSTTGQVAHYRNLTVTLMRGRRDMPYIWLIPADARISTDKGITFLQMERTWLALHPIALGPISLDEPRTRRLQFKHNRQGEPETDKQGKPVPNGPYIHAAVLSASASADGFIGFAMEVGEEQTHGSFEQFRKAVLSQSKLDLAQLAAGQATLKASNGSTVQLDAAAQRVWRNGTLRDWKDHWPLMQNADGGDSPVHLGYKQGKLRVEAGGAVFEATLTRDGKYSFTNR